MDVTDLGDMQDEDMTDECNPKTSDFVANRTFVEIESQGTKTHIISEPNSLARPDGIGAKLEAGVLYLYFLEPRKKDNMEITMEVSKQPDALPVQYCVDDFYDGEGYCNTREARVSLSVFISDISSTSMANISKGMFELRSCPGKKGSRVIGRFIDTNGYFDAQGELYSTFDAEFNVVLFESDESWDCSKITGGLCDANLED